jgi:putative FmdB family regulatory protein
MPIYEYKCDDCGTKFEKLVRRSDDAAALECPSCGEKHLTQELSTFAAQVSNGGSKAAEMPSCPSGRCGNPGMCGMNFN